VDKFPGFEVGAESRRSAPCEDARRGGLIRVGHAAPTPDHDHRAVESVRSTNWTNQIDRFSARPKVGKMTSGF